ncbi:MAG: UPF0755 protein [Vicingaceae bacterium]|jgi:UPF0755 protein
MKKKNKSLKIGGIVFLALFLGAAYLFVNYYGKIFSVNTSINKSDPYIYVSTGSSLDGLVDQLEQQKILIDKKSFLWVANQKSFNTPKPGKYKLKDGMNNNELINLLRSGQQEPVKLTFNTIRTPKDLAGKVGKQLEADSIEILRMLTDKALADKYGFNEKTFMTLFIPNTYEVYWNTSAEDFVKRMAREYKAFWTDQRKSQAKALNLTQSEVSILASIVQAEQSEHRDERPKVAGLYINRIKKSMKLQSDPTLIYAVGDFSIKRVLNKHIALDSPYNTYKYVGLPPGPINLPEISSIDAVLEYEKHDYIYMCAKADFSGYHNFSRSFFQHNAYAKAYRNELNRRKIMK